MTAQPPFETDTYYSAIDKIPVIHIDTENIPEDSNGPRCRIYLNDEPIWQNPMLPQEITEEIEENPHPDIHLEDDTHIILSFSDKKSRDFWNGWYQDGGGEQDYGTTVEYTWS